MTVKSFIQLILVIGISSICKNGFTQISKGGSPPSFFAEPLTDTVHVIQMPDIDIDSIIRNDTTNNSLFRFGYAINVDFGMDNSGTWDTLPNGDKIWRLKISSQDAYSINLIYDDFWMPADAQFFVYSEDKNMILGAFTSSNNKIHNKFSTDLVKGSTIYLEYYEPVYASHGKINVDKVIHGYEDFFQAEAVYDCYFDITCPEGDDWCIEKRAVSSILVDENTAGCTGCLINNVRQDLTPYLLTAFHCVDKNYDGILSESEINDAETWIFRFKCWSPTCDQGDVPNHWVSISGSSYKAGYHPTDMLLMELSAQPPSGLGVLYAGWDITSSPPTSSTVIHHPRANPMKISFAFNSAISAPHPVDGFNDTHWEITLNKGTTEGGSSGAPLFSPNHRIVGINTGSPHKGCPPVKKYFGRFDISWNHGLSTFLDPDNTGVTSIGPTSPTIYLINRTLTGTHKFAAIEKIHIEGNVETTGLICPLSNVPFTAESGSNVQIKAKEIVIYPGTEFKAGSNVAITATDDIICTDNIVEGDFVDIFCYANISTKIMQVGDDDFFEDAAIIAENIIIKEDITSDKNIVKEREQEQEIVDISDSIFLYPNPTDGSFIIEFTDKDKSFTEIIIYDTNGKIVHEKNNVADNKVTVNICHLAKGIYLVQINRSNISHTQRIVLR